MKNFFKVKDSKLFKERAIKKISKKNFKNGKKIQEIPRQTYCQHR